MEDYLKRIGERIRKYRKDRNMSQAELAQKAGLHYTYIGQVERGEKNITVLNLGKIASALGITSDKLLADEEEVKNEWQVTDKIIQVIQSCTEEMLEELRKI